MEELKIRPRSFLDIGILTPASLPVMLAHGRTQPEWPLASWLAVIVGLQRGLVRASGTLGWRGHAARAA